ncbi:MAG: response regulator [Chlorobiaceae bacterium]|nr:response regulator [Chlorobiaceae bacterium]
MTKKKANANGLSELRQRAEEYWPGIQKKNSMQISPDEMHRVIHELSIHQIELEMQRDELLQTRGELEESLERYTELYEFAPHGYLTLARDSTIVEASLTASSMLGEERALLKGDRFSRFITDDNLPVFNALLERVFSRNEPKYAEVMLLNHAVQPLQNKTFLPREKCMIVRIDALVTDDGQECRATLTDITRQKQTEQENVVLQESLMQAQKMESIGRLAGGVAHDFNNMLQVMLGNLDLLIESNELPGSVHEIFADLRTSVLKSAELTNQLLAFARRQAVDRQVLDFNAVLFKTINMLKRLLGSNIELIFAPAIDLWPVKMDASQIDQIITNLAINSKEAIQGSGTISIETRNVHLDDEFCKHHPEIVQGDYLLLVVHDDGCGMDKKTVDSVFEPFFTTKSKVSSSGLGLATVYGIVMQNKGLITVSSQKGKGTTFEIYLPSYTGTPNFCPSATIVENITGGNEVILLVEDDKFVRNITHEFLKSFGYTVLVASLPTEAISLSLEYPGTINLLVTDVIMPGMNGRDLALLLKKSRPGINILLISGYADNSLECKEAEELPMPFLGKPFSRNELALKIRELLDPS